MKSKPEQDTPPDSRATTTLIFVIIGYYFGRLPAQQNEQALKGHLSRQSGDDGKDAHCHAYPGSL